MSLSFFRKDKQLLGNKAEKVAKHYLIKQGLCFQANNYHSRFGEIDLIMTDSDTLVFIEVRCRRVGAQVSASESISIAKIKKIRKTAEYYLAKWEQIPDCRFDVIAITYEPESDNYTIDWIKAAF